jgi:hypothetical protein
MQRGLPSCDFLVEEVVAMVIPIVFRFGDEKKVKFSYPTQCVGLSVDFNRSLTSGKLGWKSFAPLT